ncbi:12645_t:CDS:2 [Acaulospora morrowiae]|uniref:12645_t:CDS:1 n=1 Tax=Acaulospora morrowiae TaxID=94023 RepID=A0A9N9CTM3_9GLOM|nr:12645_t:CDS:2 [Acaulospora morrowiae]
MTVVQIKFKVIKKRTNECLNFDLRRLRAENYFEITLHQAKINKHVVIPLHGTNVPLLAWRCSRKEYEKDNNVIGMMVEMERWKEGKGSGRDVMMVKVMAKEWNEFSRCSKRVYDTWMKSNLILSLHNSCDFN